MEASYSASTLDRTLRLHDQQIRNGLIKVASIQKTSRTFSLGVGAQKSGTGWLYRYLLTFPNVAATPIKEYHVWDALYIECCRQFLRQPGNLLTPIDKLRSALQHPPGLYFNHFIGLLEASARELVCDITPSYAGLQRGVLNHIRRKFEDADILTKAVFLMRDPTERCWSASRMGSRNAAGHTQVLSECVLADPMTDAFEMRTRYHLTIQELEAAFAPPNLFLGLYEQLNNIAQLRSLSSFCHVGLRPHLLDSKVNVSPKAQPLDEGVAREIAQHYRAVYEFVAKRMSAAEQLWGGYKYL